MSVSCGCVYANFSSKWTTLNYFNSPEKCCADFECVQTRDGNIFGHILFFNCVLEENARTDRKICSGDVARRRRFSTPGIPFSSKPTMRDGGGASE